MGLIGEYIISVTSAALVCSCVRSMFDGKGAVSSVLKLLCGIFLSLAVLQPLMNIELSDISAINFIQTDTAESIVAETEKLTETQQRTFISEKCQTYITQKAKELECSLSVRVFTEDQAPFAPNAVEISGSISPYAKGQLSKWINDNLAISAEDQTWIG